MKKQLLKIFVAAIGFLIMNIPLYSIPWEQLGNDAGFEMIYFAGPPKEWRINFYFQFGMINWSKDGEQVYLYGEEDLPWLTKTSMENFANNEEKNTNQDIHVYVYEANDIANPTPIQHTIVKGKIDFNLYSPNLNLENGRLYIVVFLDAKGSVLDVKKIMPTE